jgi:hypothetical protein
MNLEQAQQLISELQGNIDSMRRVLAGVDWSPNAQERKPSVVIGLCLGKLVTTKRLSSSIESLLRRASEENTDRARITHKCEHCDDTMRVEVFVNGHERVVPCRSCGPFSHSGAVR